MLATALSNSSTIRKTGIEDMDTPDRVRLLGVIDQFRDLGVNEDISLPQVSVIILTCPYLQLRHTQQLVVVGDQSSGKSSVLEGLTELNFPIASDLCTRHATQIVLRRTLPGEAASVKVSIIPGPSANGNEEYKFGLESFAWTLGVEFSAEEFKVILDEVSALPLKRPGSLILGCLSNGPSRPKRRHREPREALLRRYIED